MSNRQPVAYVICGFIGAGKTTFARKLEKETGAIRVTKDEWIIRIFGNQITSNPRFEGYDRNVTELATDIAFRILRANTDVILDEGFWAKSQREGMRKRISDLGAIPIFYYVECPVEIMRERVVDRSKKPPIDSFEISGEMFDSYYQYWQAPDESEDVLVIRSSEM